MNAAHLTVPLAWCLVPLSLEAEALAALVRACGGILLSVAWQPGIGRYATALGLDDASLRLLASIAPDEGGCPN